MNDHNCGLWSAIFRSMLGRYAAYTASLLSLMILARVFTPEDFGLIAAVQVFFTFGLILSESGFGPAIINLTHFSARERDGVYVISVLLGLSVAAAILLGTPAIVAFYDSTLLAAVIPWLALSLIFASATIVPQAHLLKDQRFYAVGACDTVAEVLSTGLALAFWRWALLPPLECLAARMPARTAIKWICALHMSGQTSFGRPAFAWNPRAVVPLLRFSTFQLGFNAINFFSRNLDQMLIARYFGLTQLGLYEKSYALMRYPLQLLTFAMTPAIQPVLQQHAHDPGRVRNIHTAFALRMAALGLAAGALVWLLAPWIVTILLGPSWTKVVPILKILAWAIPVQVVLSSSGAFFQAMDRTGLMFLSGAISACTMVSAMIYGVMADDMHRLCWALVVAFHVNAIQCYWLMYTRVLRPASSAPPS